MYTYEIIKAEENRYVIRIYRDNEISMIQDINPENGETFKTIEEAANYAKKILSELLGGSNEIFFKKVGELSKLTYEFILKHYPDSKQKSDIVDKEFQTIFLIRKGNYTTEEIGKTIYDKAAKIVDGISDIQTEIAEFNKIYKFKEGDKVYSIELTNLSAHEIDLNKKEIVPSSLSGTINYLGKDYNLTDKEGKIVNNDTNEVIGIIDYTNGKITLDTSSIDIKGLNKISIYFKTYLIIHEAKAQEQLLKVGIRVSQVQNIKFIYQSLIEELKNYSIIELENLDINSLINKYYAPLKI